MLKRDIHNQSASLIAGLSLFLFVTGSFSVLLLSFAGAKGPKGNIHIITHLNNPGCSTL